MGYGHGVWGAMLLMFTMFFKKWGTTWGTKLSRAVLSEGRDLNAVDEVDAFDQFAQRCSDARTSIALTIPARTGSAGMLQLRL